MKNTLKILFCALAFSLAACGGGGGGGSTPPKTTPPQTETPPQGNQDPVDSTPTPPEDPVDTTPEEPEEPVDPTDPTEPTLPPEFVDPAGPYAPTTAAVAPTDREGIEKVIGFALLINQAAGSLNPIPDDIGPQVEARGHLNWNDPNTWYTVPLMFGGEVRVEFWSDLGVEGYSHEDFLALTANEAGIHRVSGPFSIVEASDTVREYHIEHTMAQWGIYVADTKNYRLDGSIFVEPHAVDGFHLMYSVDYDSFNTEFTVKETTPEGIVDYDVKYDLYTKAENPGMVEGFIEWERQNDGVYQYMQTFTPVMIDAVAGHVQMVSGSFQYVHEAGESQRVLRVSVAADPAFLRVEVDQDWDGEYDSELTIPQSDINFLLP